VASSFTQTRGSQRSFVKQCRVRVASAVRIYTNYGVTEIFCQTLQGQSGLTLSIFMQTRGSHRSLFMHWRVTMACAVRIYIVYKLEAIEISPHTPEGHSGLHMHTLKGHNTVLTQPPQKPRSHRIFTPKIFFFILLFHYHS
jgi:hypothetical protein